MLIIIDKKNVVYLQKPLTSEDFADHIWELVYLKTLHPNVNKNVLKEVKTVYPPSDDHSVENVAIKKSKVKDGKKGASLYYFNKIKYVCAW